MTAESFAASFPDTLTQNSSDADAIIATAQNNANTSLTTALAYLSAIPVPTAPATIDVAFSVPTDIDTPAAPDVPVAPDPFDGNAIDVPAPPNFPVLTLPELDAANIDPPARPDYLVFPEPDALDIDAPDSPVLEIVAFPSEPEFMFPDLPEILDLDLPTPPALTLPTFTDTKPVNTASLAGVETHVSATAVSLTALGADIEAQVRTILIDGRGLPPEIELMIYERARGREDALGQKMVLEAIEDFAARGFSLPSGALAGRVAEVRRAAADKVSGVSRDTQIKATDTQIDLFKTALAQGIAYEQVCVEASRATAEFALQASRATIEIGIRLYEAAIRGYEVEVTAYNVSAQVYRERVQAALASVELYKALIEGEKLKTDISRINAEVYAEELKGVLVQVDIYRVQMDGAKARIEQNLARIESFKAVTEAYATRVGAKKSEFEAWGEANKVNAYIAQSYSAEVQGYAEKIRALLGRDQLKITAYEGAIRNNQSLAQQYAAQIEGVRTVIQAQSTAADSRSRNYAGQAAIYASQEGVRSSQLNSSIARFGALVDYNRQQAQIALAVADANVKNGLNYSQIVVESAKGAAQAASSLAAGAMSAIHAGASTNMSNSIGQNISWNSTAGVSENTSF